MPDTSGIITEFYCEKIDKGSDVAVNNITALLSGCFMVTTVLLVMIYLSFICLGLPDSLLGSAWQAMYGDVGAAVSSAGMISVLVSGGTILSSLFSSKVIARFGTGKTSVCSIALTVAALFGYAASDRLWQLCLWAIPMGLGAGSVDAALNHYVALHYSARHMNWLHCFWGVGATMGPILFSRYLGETGGWSKGFRSIGTLQLILVLLLACSLPLWRKAERKFRAEAAELNAIQRKSSLRDAIQLPGITRVLLCFFAYCALEATTGLWGSSFLVMVKQISADKAAKLISLFYFGIMAGRLLCGFVSVWISDRVFIGIGQSILAVGIILLLVPTSNTMLMAAGFALIGLGCAPIYPSTIHETPRRFGKENAQTVIGIQMAAAYTGSTFMPPVFGLLAGHGFCRLFPALLLVYLLLMRLCAPSKKQGCTS